MIQIALPLITSLIGLFENKSKSLSKKAGVTEDVMSSVTSVLSDFLTKDEQALELTMKHLQEARLHDIATFDKNDFISNRLRSLVRPICTFVAITWYVFARVNDIPLYEEDYAIIGGILAFWFGFRPFEKRK